MPHGDYLIDTVNTQYARANLLVSRFLMCFYQENFIRIARGSYDKRLTGRFALPNRRPPKQTPSQKNSEGETECHTAITKSTR